MKRDRDKSQQIEDALRSYYTHPDESTPTPDFWSGISTQLLHTEKNPAPVHATAVPSYPRHRRLPGYVRWMASVAAVICVLIGSLYVSPRLEVRAAALIRGNANKGPVESVLRDDSGLLQAMQNGAFQPVGLSATANGLRLDVLDFYTDANRTILVYHVTGGAPASANSKPPQSGTSQASGTNLTHSLTIQPWQIVLDNSEETSTNSVLGKTGTAIQNYPIYLRDQFGLTHRCTQVVRQGSYGYLEFPAIPGVMKDLGLRLTLHVQGMQAIQAPDGAFGRRVFQSQQGPWNISFVALPYQGNSVQRTPNVTVSNGDASVTLNSVRVSQSEVQVRLTLRGLPTFASGQNGGTTDAKGQSQHGSSTAIPTSQTLHFTIDPPSGPTLQPTTWSRSGSAVQLNFPPLTAGGAYTLVATNGVKTLRVTWSQPKWTDHGSSKAPPETSSPIYQGVDFSTASAQLEFPAYAPPAGWKIQRITVEPDYNPILSGNLHTTPRLLSMKLVSPTGQQYIVDETRAFLSLIPETESLQEFLQVTHKQTGGHVSLSQTWTNDSTIGQLWTVRSDDGRQSPVVFLYPSWGSVEIAAVPPKVGGQTNNPVTTNQATLALANSLVSGGK